MKKAIITLYCPTESNFENVEKIAKQVDHVYICDNSKIRSQIQIKADNITYIFFGNNLGLSCAFNKVLKNKDYLWELDDFIFFFDQDSQISENHINKMISEYNSLKEQNYNVGCLGPIYFNNSSNKLEIPHVKKKIVKNVYSVKSIITSSMLTTYENLQNIDFWNENIFLDMADWDLCWRFLDKQYICCLTDSVVLNHTLGEGDKKYGVIRVKNSSPIREYYQTRDCLNLLKKDYVPLKFKVRFIAMITIRPLLHFVFLNDKKRRLYYIKKGISDFYKNKKGEFSETD